MNIDTDRAQAGTDPGGLSPELQVQMPSDSLEYLALSCAVDARFHIGSEHGWNLAAELVDVLWLIRRARVGAYLVKGPGDPGPYRGDRDLDALLRAEFFLCRHGIHLDDHDLAANEFATVVDLVASWVGQDLELFSHVKLPESVGDRAALVEGLWRRRWGTWQEAASHARALAIAVEMSSGEPRGLFTWARSDVELDRDLIVDPEGAEASLVAERDRIVALLTQEAATAGSEPFLSRVLEGGEVGDQ